MTALITAQLDELERKLIGGQAHMVPVSVTHQLVAIARAALAWSEARAAYQTASEGAEESNAAMFNAMAKLEVYRKAEAALDVATKGTP